MRIQNSWPLVIGIGLLSVAIGLPYLMVDQMAEDISLLYGFLVVGLMGMLFTFVGVKRAMNPTFRKASSPRVMGETDAEHGKHSAPRTASSQSALSSELLIERVQAMTAGLDTSWVLFKRGTIVLLPKAVGDLRQIAIDFLRENGHVVAGTPLGDFAVCRIKRCPGWIVTSHDPNLHVYVGPEENTGDADLAIGLYGRSKRGQDANDLFVLHIEDKRPAS